jgi:hypothetical protein
MPAVCSETDRDTSFDHEPPSGAGVLVNLTVRGAGDNKAICVHLLPLECATLPGQIPKVDNSGA